LPFSLALILHSILTLFPNVVPAWDSHPGVSFSLVRRMRHFARGHIPFGRPCNFQGSAAIASPFWRKNSPLPYIQEVGKRAEKRSFPRLWTRQEKGGSGRGDTAMQPKLTIQERLKDLRVERGLTLEQLSAETEISKSALGKYEADDFKDICPFSLAKLRSSTACPPIICRS